MLAWVNGGLVDAATPQIRLDDHGFTVADGVFETLKTVRGRPFALDRHVNRLERSAAGLGLAAPPRAQVYAAIAQVADANQQELAFQPGRIRITYTSGPGPLGSDRGPGPATLVVTAQAGRPWPPTTTVGLAPWPRNERSPTAGLKCTSYAENAIALAWAKGRGHSEALLANLRGELCEGTGSNVFLVLDGALVTPPLGSGCLAGITRELVLTWCDVSERTLPAQALVVAEEIFLTSSTRDIHPVHLVDDHELTAPGPVTRRCQEVFAERSAADLNP